MFAHSFKIHAVFFALGTVFSAGPAFAENWPTKPITIIVPFPAGGGTDVVMRSIQPLLTKALGQSVVIDNRSGAGGTIGSATAARAQPDGYTAVMATTSTHAVSVGIYKNLPYDPSKDFEYAGLIGTSPYVLAAQPSLGVKDVKALLEVLKKNPDRYSFASVGVGTVSHLMAEQFKLHAGVAAVHVPYRGAAPAYTDLIGGQVELMFDNPIAMAPHAESGKVVAIATTAPTSLLPGVQTFQQQGIADFTQQLWYGIAFPKQTPAHIVDRFNAALNKALADPALASELAKKGIVATPGRPDALDAAVAKDISYWGAITTSIGANIE